VAALLRKLYRFQFYREMVRLVHSRVRVQLPIFSVVKAILRSKMAQSFSADYGCGECHERFDRVPA